MRIPRLVLATRNRGKVDEIRQIIAGWDLVDEVVADGEWDEVDETGETLEANALLKARAVVEATGFPALADDTGLEVAALGGRPGVHTARYAGPDATYDDNIDRLLSELGGASDRSARFVTVVALVFLDGSYHTAEGSIQGRIGEERRGSGGFGYDPVFEVGGVTFAEMGVEAKNRLSHRAVALQRLGEWLRSA
ncbi:MAG TPA: RdgB/HAM1 family non-canonical purine NTP pyrophosphatase [Acidimicrobiia bacterium]|nr:RdgB/HAM1 family non-canonical purine NTP pyrophosphatase [Acidimicrobiia bacterium]